MAHFNRYKKRFKRYRSAYRSFRSRPALPRRRRKRNTTHPLMRKKIFGLPFILVIAAAAYMFVPAVKTFVAGLIAKIKGISTTTTT